MRNLVHTGNQTHCLLLHKTKSLLIISTRFRYKFLLLVNVIDNNKKITCNFGISPLKIVTFPTAGRKLLMLVINKVKGDTFAL